MIYGNTYYIYIFIYHIILILCKYIYILILTQLHLFYQITKNAISRVFKWVLFQKYIIHVNVPDTVTLNGIEWDRLGHKCHVASSTSAFQMIYESSSPAAAVLQVGCGPGVVCDISQVWGIRYLTDSSSNRFGEDVRQVPPPLKHSTVCWVCSCYL